LVTFGRKEGSAPVKFGQIDLEERFQVTDVALCFFRFIFWRMPWKHDFGGSFLKLRLPIALTWISRLHISQAQTLSHPKMSNPSQNIFHTLPSPLTPENLGMRSLGIILPLDFQRQAMINHHRPIACLLIRTQRRLEKVYQLWPLASRLVNHPLITFASDASLLSLLEPQL
jgi:hypothetical protein